MWSLICFCSIRQKKIIIFRWIISSQIVYGYSFWTPFVLSPTRKRFRFDLRLVLLFCLAMSCNLSNDVYSDSDLLYTLSAIQELNCLTNLFTFCQAFYKRIFFFMIRFLELQFLFNELFHGVRMHLELNEPFHKLGHMWSLAWDVYLIV